MALEWQTKFVPLAAGLQQSTDPRALDPPGLSIAKDVQFDEDLGLTTRKPFAALSANIDGGGTISTARRLVAHGDELLLFDKDTLYSWNSAISKWVSKGTHVATKIDERTVFVNTNDQSSCDRAELNGIIAFTWSEGATGYIAAIDKTTGAVALSPTSLGAVARLRVVALSTKILLLYVTAGGINLVGAALDPANPAGWAGTSTFNVSTVNFNSYYDVVKIPGADTAVFAGRETPTTQYVVGKITSGGSVSTSVKPRTCDGPIAVSCEPTGTSVQIVRGNGTNVQGDLITISSLADVFTGQAIGTAVGTPINQIAAAHRSVQNGGQYRCYAFWSAQEVASSSGFELKTNYADTNNSLGTQSVIRLRLGVASRAFDYDGHVYVWGAFSGQSGAAGMGEPLGFRAQLQNTYFLYRDDGHFAAKAAFDVAGGFSALTGHLPGVALTSGSTVYSWCGVERRVIPLGGDHTGYSDRGPRDLTITFDSNDARRTARIGSTLYVAGGQILQYDGTGLYEVGFHLYPWLFAGVAVGGGSLPAGKYSFKATMRWDNATGERERSTTATGEQDTSAGAQKIQIQIANLHVTRKTSAAPAIEVWRTLVNPQPDSPFYLATSPDPTVVAGNDCYLANVDTSSFTALWTDDMVDATLSAKETNPENGAVLEALAPPAASVIVATDTRLFLGGVAGDKDRVWYSRQRNVGEVCSFHDGNVIDVPREGGDITALAFDVDGTLIVFRRAAVYAFPGDGLDNLGGGLNYGPVRTLSTDVGALSHEGVALTPLGIVFKSSKGWQLLNGRTVTYIGAPIADNDASTVLAVHVVERQHQVRVLTAANMLVLDYRVRSEASPFGQWAEWTISDGVHAAMWSGTYTYLAATGPRTEQSSYSGVNYGLDIETAWIKLTDLQGFGRVRWFEILGELASSCLLRVRVALNYRESFYIDDRAMSPSGNPLQLRHAPSQGQCEAIKVRLTAIGTSSVTATRDTSPGGNWAGGGPLGTSGSNWAATIAASVPGIDGGDPVLSIYACAGTGVELRDNQVFNGTSWGVAEGEVGVRVGVGATIAQLEAALATSRKIRVQTPDPTPTKVIANSGSVHEIGLIGGADAAPSGEAIRLTGLSLDLGFKPGLYRHLPATAKQ